VDILDVFSRLRQIFVRGDDDAVAALESFLGDGMAQVAIA